MNNRFDSLSSGIAINIWAPDWNSDSVIRFNADEIAQAVKDAGADALYMWQGFSQDHFGYFYYPTLLGPKHPNLKAGRDHLKEIVDALHRHNLIAVGYYSYTDFYIWKNYPDWRQKDSEGNDVPRYNFGALCPNSPYRELAIARQVEMVQRYDIDAICILDSLEFLSEPHTCYCDYCKKKYYDQFGKMIPVWTEMNEDWARFIKWRYQCVEELLDDCRAAIREIRPDLPITHFCFTLYGRDEWGAGDYYEKTALDDDFATTISGIGGKVRTPNSIWKIGFHTRYLKSMSGKSAHVHIPRFMYNREFQTIPEHEMKLAVSSVTAANGIPIIADNLNPNGTINPLPWRRIHQAYSSISKEKKHKGVSIASTALYFSKSSHDYCCTVNPRANKYLKEYQSAYKMLQELHVSFDIVTDRELTEQSLAKYKILIIPDAPCLLDTKLEIIEMFVANGGTLISSSRIATQAHRHSTLSEILGFIYVSPITYSSSFIKLDKMKWLKCTDTHEEIIQKGNQYKVKPLDGAKILAKIVMPATEVVPNKRTLSFTNDIHPQYLTNHPAIILNEYKKGKSLYFSFDLFGMYGVYGYESCFNLFQDSSDEFIIDQQSFRVEAPRHIEACGYKLNDHLEQYHFVNYAVNSSGINDVGSAGTYGFPCDNIKLHLNTQAERRVKKIYRNDTLQLFEYLTENNIITINLPTVEIILSITIEYE